MESVWGISGYRLLEGTAEDKRPLGRYRCRWEDDITMNYKEIGW